MKPTRVQLFFCISLLTVSLLGFASLQAGAAADVEKSPLPVFRRPGSSPPPGFIEISIRYEDFGRLRHSFTCWIDERFARDEADAFGIPLDPESILDELDRRLAEAVEQKAGRLAQYATITVTHKNVAAWSLDDPVLWDFEIQYKHWEEELPEKSRLPPELRPKARVFKADIQASRMAMADTVFRDYHREHGFAYEQRQGGEKWRLDIDYPSLANKARPQLGDCYEKLVREAAPADEEARMKLLLAAFQEMELEFPPSDDGKTYKAGFWVPTQVLQRGRGDCDSRAIALCALWQRPRPQIALLVRKIPDEEKQELPLEWRVDEHALLAIEAYAGAKQATVSIDGSVRPYILCEVVRRFRARKREKVALGIHFFSGPELRKVCMTDDCFGP